ncbi:glycine-rich RNA-binding protein 5, mitochondrial-like isoform X2 [Raphanus sativus]|nr:glycine-rich RNA-binding protein 5, mitochondrial-like isoform X2 [Raphanus sativus]
MAFLSKVGGIFRQTSTHHVTASNLMMLRCMSSSKTFGVSHSILPFIRSFSSSKIFVGGISYRTDEVGLREAFSHFGQIVDAEIVVDRETGRSRGFAFVTFTSNEDACNATDMDGEYLHGRRLRVNYATERGSGFGGGGGYRGRRHVFYDDLLPCGCEEGFSVWSQ